MADGNAVHILRLIGCCLLGWACIPALSTADEYSGAPEPKTAAEVYGQGVRETDWQAPAQEQSGFHLPQGFSIELFAAEPEIDKPLNMAWDQRGRLWVSSTVEYPYPAQAGQQPRDRIVILEDSDGDGRAETSHTFADGLNIPMGLLPVADGVICFSIPNIWYLRDTDGDDRADEREVLLGPFDTTRDTHGMINALRRGADGWIYACHGFNNQSHVTAADGSQVVLVSGNTFRFRDDGSHIEQFTQGQVNPFGMTRDEWGNWYTADCHSKPITALLPGACYPSFGRPHDGLGFAPSMMQHLHGSTAIGGIEYYQGTSFPEAYRGKFYSGNVMTSRINCNALQWQGATAIAAQMPDFLTSDDPWFRPVDLQLGPDGALYVADFYNKIIGHYEVPLTHPGRDRTSGRIWRIAYDDLGPPHQSPSVSEQSDLLPALGDENPTRRRAAIERVVQAAEIKPEDVTPWLLDASQSIAARLSAAEILFRTGRLIEESLRQGLVDPQAKLRVQLLRQTATTASVSAATLACIRQNLEHASPHVVIAAIDCLGQHGTVDDIEILLRLSTRDDDPALAHAARIAARELLRDESSLRQFEQTWLNSENDGPERSALIRSYARVLPGLDSGPAAASLLRFALSPANRDEALVEQAFQLGKQHVSAALIEDMLRAISTLEQNVSRRAARFRELWQAVHERGSVVAEPSWQTASAALDAQSRQLQRELVADMQRQFKQRGAKLEWFSPASGAWPLDQRQCSDGQPVKLLSSFPLGESYTGSLHSEPFACPSELRFWIAGHNGNPRQSDHGKNALRLVLAATGAELFKAAPPRNDTAREVVWDLSPWLGQHVQLIATDGDSAAAYAWVAFGRFSLEPLNPDQDPDSLNALAEIVALRPAVREATVASLLAAKPSDGQSLEPMPLSNRQRTRLMQAWWQGGGAEVEAALAELAVTVGRSDIIAQLTLDARRQAELWDQAVRELLASATEPQQQQFALRLLRSAAGGEFARDMIERGWLSVAVLRGHAGLLPANLQGETRASLEALIAQAKLLELDLALPAQRLAKLDWPRADAAQGQQLYRQHCANCHQLGGDGKLVGPQLDGAIARGRERLAEDILLPNLNVDRAFRLSSLLLDDDRVVSGLVVDRAPGFLDVVQQDGQTLSLTAERIVERRDSENSLMPNNFSQLLDDGQLAALLKYLVEFVPPRDSGQVPSSP